jgi:peptidoglycan/LPS O-acetylase OafA/YrhL
MRGGVAIDREQKAVPARAPGFELHHVPALDGLRGLAVAGVLAFHGGHLTGGYLGVDLFFVLSGFLITSLLLREWGTTTTIGLRRFWERRARRLLPAIFGLLIGLAVYVVVWAKPYEYDSIRAAALGTVLYVANWQALATGHGYWDLFTTPSPLQHTWSLAIEEQFYLVWPVLVFAVLRWRRRRMPGASPAAAIFALASGLAVASCVWMMVRVVPGEDTSRVYFGTDTRAASILFGAALAAWLSWRGTARDGRTRRVIEGVAAVGALWLAFAWVNVDGQSTFLYRGGFLFSALAVVAIIASCAQRTGGPIERALSIPPLRWLGLISYGLYLWHWPVFLVLQIERNRLGLSEWTLFGAQLAVSLGFACLSFFVLERPIRRGGFPAWGPRGRVLMPAAAALALVLVLATTTGGETLPDFAYQPTSADGGAAGITRGTVPEVADDGPAPSASAIAATAPAPSTSTPAVAAPPYTVGPMARPAGRDPRLLVVGDSVAHYLGEGIERQPDLHVRVANQSMYKCTLGREYGDWKRRDGIIDQENADCRRWPTIWSDAINRFKPDAVLLTFGGPPQGTLHIGPGDDWYAPCTSEYRDYYRGEVEAAIGVLTAKGAVLFLAPSAHPRFPFLPDDIDERTDCVNAVYREAAAAHPDTVHILPIDDWTCPPPGKTCVEVLDGVNLREDGIHYRGPGEDVAARWTVPQLFTTP